MERENRDALFKIIVAIVLSALISGIAYYVRENYLPLTGWQSSLVRTIRMTGVYVLIPFWWAMTKFGTRWKDFGITRKNLLKSMFYGGLVYSVALIVFISQVDNPVFYRTWAAGYTQMTSREIMLNAILFSWMAAITDLWTRGFILMQVTRYSTPTIGVITQNIAWMVVHLYEIALLAPTLSIPGAILLTIVLGTTGDVVALRTGNILGLAFGHVLLNIGFIAYVIF